MKGKSSELPVPSTSQPPRSRRNKPAIWRLTLVACSIFVLYRVTPTIPEWPANPPLEGRNPAYLVRARHGAVASENKRCSDIGVNTLRQGGNAVDAAVSTTLCTGVVNMFSSGIGGGGFMTIRVPSSNSATNRTESKVYTIDFRETAPAASNATMFLHDPLSSKFGGLSVGVPGELRGLSEAHRRWGRLPWKDLVLPSVNLAAGWEVDPELGRRLEWYKTVMLNDPNWSQIFAPDGRLLKTGDLVHRTAYSQTLAKIANEGADAFYTGYIADAIVKKVQDTGGILTLKDLQGYKVEVKRALEGTYRGKKVYTTHAPTSGPVLLHMLNLLERFDLKKRDGLLTHRLVEILRFGYAARTRICDPAYANDTDLIDEILTQKFNDHVFANITDDTTHPPEYYNPIYDVPEDHGTSHSSMVDQDGMAVAITSTVNLIFGSLVLDTKTGILLNDEMDDFSIPGIPNYFGLWPSPYNYPASGKRPLSSTVPTVIENEDGSFHTAIGGAGGSRILSAVFQVLVNLELGLNPSDAVEHGRIHDQLYPLQVDIDSTYPSALVDDLKLRGHNVTVGDIRRVTSVVQIVTEKDGDLWAASDSRKAGVASGY